MVTATASVERLFNFVGGTAGPWLVDRLQGVTGEGPSLAARLSVSAATMTPAPGTAAWRLRGITSNERYVMREEKNLLVSRQEGLGRAASTRAALIPILKTAAWWAIARRLLHCRGLGPEEPFDFLTWFEYAPAAAPAFEELVIALRASPEWKFVDREVDIRLIREYS